MGFSIFHSQSAATPIFPSDGRNGLAIPDKAHGGNADAKSVNEVYGDVVVYVHGI